MKTTPPVEISRRHFLTQASVGLAAISTTSLAIALDATNYRGWLGIEGIKTPLGVEESVRYDVNYLRPIFPRSL